MTFNDDIGRTNEAVVASTTSLVRFFLALSSSCYFESRPFIWCLIVLAWESVALPVSRSVYLYPDRVGDFIFSQILKGRRKRRFILCFIKQLCSPDTDICVHGCEVSDARFLCRENDVLAVCVLLSLS